MGKEKYWGGRMRKGDGDEVLGKEVGKFVGMLGKLGVDWILVGRLG